MLEVELVRAKMAEDLEEAVASRQGVRQSRCKRLGMKRGYYPVRYLDLHESHGCGRLLHESALAFAPREHNSNDNDDEQHDTHDDEACGPA